MSAKRAMTKPLASMMARSPGNTGRTAVVGTGCPPQNPGYTAYDGHMDPPTDGSGHTLICSGTAKYADGSAATIKYTADITSSYFPDINVVGITMTSTGTAKASGMKPLIRTPRIPGATPHVEASTNAAGVGAKETQYTDTITAVVGRDSDYFKFDSDTVGRTYALEACVGGEPQTVVLRPGDAIIVTNSGVTPAK
jgi:hypothetical protein